MMLTRSPETLEAIEQAICSHGGVLLDACRSLSINLYDLSQWCTADPEVAAAVKAAQMVGWASLESEAYRRAVKGVDEAVYYQGEVVGEKRVYSDGLLSMMMKARVPGYSQDSVPGQGVTVNVAIMPRASTYEEWLVHRDQQLQLTDSSVQDAEFEPVPDGRLPDVL